MIRPSAPTPLQSVQQAIRDVVAGARAEWDERTYRALLKFLVEFVAREVAVANGWRNGDEDATP